MRVVIPSCQYADMLRVTLPAWRGLLPRDAITLVTSLEDAETAALAASHGVPVHVTDAWTRDGATFNKARALDEAFGFASGYRDPPPDGEVCLSLDADVFPFGQWPASSTIKPDTIYGCARYRCRSSADLRAHLMGTVRRRELALIPPGMRKGPKTVPLANTPANAIETGSRCLGYFQLFRWKPGLSFGTYNTAAKYDLAFRDRFPRKVGLAEIYVLHLGEQDRQNWRGRMLPRWQEA